MNTTNNKVLLTTVVVGALALFGLTKMTADVVPMMAIGGAYVAVAILGALAYADYRLGSKNYLVR